MNYDKLKELSDRIGTIKKDIKNEQATINSLVLPLFSILGYDIHDPSVFKPQYSIMNDRVDFGIYTNGKLSILLEVKHHTENLNLHYKQLFNYYSPTDAKFAILTNGIVYWFYADLLKDNIMDSEPFFVFNLQDFDDADVDDLQLFYADNFDTGVTKQSAYSMMYYRHILELLADYSINPPDELIRLLHREIDCKLEVCDFKHIASKVFAHLTNTNSEVHTMTNGSDTLSETEQKAFNIVSELLSPTYEASFNKGRYLYITVSDIRVCWIYDGKNTWLALPAENETTLSFNKDKTWIELSHIDDIKSHKTEILLAAKRVLGY